jgi:hypothetical protein
VSSQESESKDFKKQFNFISQLLDKKGLELKIGVCGCGYFSVFSH